MKNYKVYLLLLMEIIFGLNDAVQGLVFLRCPLLPQAFMLMMDMIMAVAIKTILLMN